MIWILHFELSNVQLYGVCGRYVSVRSHSITNHQESLAGPVECKGILWLGSKTAEKSSTARS
jgi:hypothetical protein